MVRITKKGRDSLLRFRRLESPSIPITWIDILEQFEGSPELSNAFYFEIMPGSPKDIWPREFKELVDISDMIEAGFLEKVK